MKTFFGVEIPKRNAKCSKLQEDILCGDTIYSILKTMDDAYIREDYCLSCWKNMETEFLESNFLSWRSVVPKKSTPKDVFVNKDQKALALLLTLMHSEALEEQHQAFILSLYLARRKQIYLRKEFVSEHGETALLYEIASTEESLLIKKFVFSELNLLEIQKVIAKKLL